jgi:hypothetical protein
MAVKEMKISVTTTGSAGSATGTGQADAIFRGKLLGFRVKYHASAPATTDTTITSTLPSGYVAHPLLTLTNINTDIPYRPVMSSVYDSSNTEATDFFAPIPLTGHNITVSVAGSDALADAVIVWAVYEGD